MNKVVSYPLKQKQNTSYSMYMYTVRTILSLSQKLPELPTIFSLPRSSSACLHPPHQQPFLPVLHMLLEELVH